MLLTMTYPTILWFRQDLRLADNPALLSAVETERPILPVYIFDDVNSANWIPGGASRWWLHRSLELLSASLENRLVVMRGDASQLLPELVKATGAEAVMWNRCYEPWRVKRDSAIKARLLESGIDVRSFNGSLLFEPPNPVKDDGSGYKVFTPYYRNAQMTSPPAEPQPAPDKLRFFKWDVPPVDSLDLLPSGDWYQTLEQSWQPGEQAALRRLNTFLTAGFKVYAELRNRPDLDNVSRLSPHLHHGEISPNQAWWAAGSAEGIESRDLDSFRSELGWREFSHYLLYHRPDLPSTNMQQKFDQFPWREDPESFENWCRGRTGIPFIDAGMRELWQTGYMHNRVRMVAASFLVKNLLIDWRQGAQWFWDTLVDADLANNSASWQWVAGCGTDAAPYFRIFNPVTQGKKFDPDGHYVRKFVPEIAALPNSMLHNPWDAPPELLATCQTTSGEPYPAPIVDLASSRQRALAAFRDL